MSVVEEGLWNEIKEADRGRAGMREISEKDIFADGVRRFTLSTRSIRLGDEVGRGCFVLMAFVWLLAESGTGLLIREVGL